MNGSKTSIGAKRFLSAILRLVFGLVVWGFVFDTHHEWVGNDGLPTGDMIFLLWSLPLVLVLRWTDIRHRVSRDDFLQKGPVRYSTGFLLGVLVVTAVGLGSTGIQHLYTGTAANILAQRHDYALNYFVFLLDIFVGSIVYIIIPIIAAGLALKTGRDVWEEMKS
jgi:hypothetical protein